MQFVACRDWGLRSLAQDALHQSKLDHQLWSQVVQSFQAFHRWKSLKLVRVTSTREQFFNLCGSFCLAELFEVYNDLMVNVCWQHLRSRRLVWRSTQIYSTQKSTLKEKKRFAKEDQQKLQQVLGMKMIYSEAFERINGFQVQPQLWCHLWARLRESEDVVNEEQHILLRFKSYDLTGIGGGFETSLRLTLGAQYHIETTTLWISMMATNPWGRLEIVASREGWEPQCSKKSAYFSCVTVISNRIRIMNQNDIDYTQ